MKFLSVCSGIEAASVAWEPLGWKAAGFYEIEPFPCALLAHRYPDTPNFGDLTRHSTHGSLRYDFIGRYELLVGGTPCQGFSIAGLRKGMADPRSQLAYAFVELAAKDRPAWLVWENVSHVLKIHGGQDYADLLAAFTGRRVRVPRGGWQNSGCVEGIPEAYGIAWRVLDAQFFGVPQRRRRVFLVGYLGDWRLAAAVLFEREGMLGNPPPRFQARENPPGAPAHPSGNRGRSAGGFGRVAAQTALSSHSYVAFAHQAGGKQTTLGFDPDRESAPTLTKDQTPAICCFDSTQITNPDNRSNPQPGGPCHPLAANAHPPAIAFSCKDHGADAGELAPTRRSMGHDGSHANGGGQLAVAFQPRIGRNGRGYSEHVVPALGGADAGATSDMRPCVAAPAYVRRLTPRECERLQGFPDDYTLIPGDHRPRKPEDRAETVAYLIGAGFEPAEAEALANHPDGPRYKALGNSKAVPVVRWIGERIQLVESLTLKTAAS